MRQSLLYCSIVVWQLVLDMNNYHNHAILTILPFYIRPSSLPSSFITAHPLHPSLPFVILPDMSPLANARRIAT
jgi:hypothetical protein